jgi:hypothetical protein
MNLNPAMFNCQQLFEIRSQEDRAERLNVLNMIGALTQLDPKRVHGVFYEAGGNEQCCIGGL